MGKFAQSVKAQINVAKEDYKYVAGASLQDVVEHAQTSQDSVKITGGSFEIGKIPVDDRDLIKSLRSKINGSVVGEGVGSYSAAIKGFELGDTLEFEWTAAHAMRIEHGFTGTDELGRKYNQPGRHFVGANAARFPEFVENRVQEVKRK